MLAGKDPLAIDLAAERRKKEAAERFDDALAKARPAYELWLERAPCSPSSAQNARYENRWPDYPDFTTEGAVFYQAIPKSELLHWLCYAANRNSGGPISSEYPRLTLDKKYGVETPPPTHTKILDSNVPYAPTATDYYAWRLAGSVFKLNGKEFIVEWLAVRKEDRMLA